jgi:hypothetical protein
MPASSRIDVSRLLRVEIPGFREAVMADTRRFRRGHIAGIVTALLGAASSTSLSAADASGATASGTAGSISPELFASGIASEFGFTLGEFIDPKRSKFPAPKPQDNGNLYFVLKLAKPSGPFEQVVVGLSPRSQLVLTLRARKEFPTSAACQAALEQLSVDMKSRLGVKPVRSSHTASWVIYNLEQAPVTREMSCNDKRLDFYVFDKKLIFQGVTESGETSQQAAVVSASQR